MILALGLNSHVSFTWLCVCPLIAIPTTACQVPNSRGSVKLHRLEMTINIIIAMVMIIALSTSCVLTMWQALGKYYDI